MAETKCIASEEAFCNTLGQILRQLQAVHSGIVTAVCALRYQNCERDEDIACTLLYGVGDRLDVQIERIAELISSAHPLSIHPDEIVIEPRH